MPVYTRFLEVFLTGPGGWTDFHADIKPQLQYQSTKHALRAVRLISIRTSLFGSDVTSVVPKPPPKDVDRYNYLTVAVPVADIDRGTTTPVYRTYMKWAGDLSQVGKIRINCHGDGKGNLLMGSRDRKTVDSTTARKLVAWLNANGMAAPHFTGGTGLPFDKADKGFITLSMAFCMAARGASGPAFTEPIFDVVNPGPNSAVADAVDSFAALGWHGIEVTGSNEIIRSSSTGMQSVVMMPTTVAASTSAATFAAKPAPAVTFLPGRLPSGTGTTLTVPVPFKVAYDASVSKGTITVPDWYRVFRTAGGWRIEPPAFHVPSGWAVEPGAGGYGGTITTPFGWDVTPAPGTDAGGGISSAAASLVLPSGGRPAAAVQDLRKSVVKVRSIS
ncbi:hypothetical protein [Rhodospirillum centenum]|uniref:Uncharacterized protein n=1 Tax=Rhodospirillum centenum (strain ATCC 51521 / SW) TaxID=414684 RepID=B6IUB9_RHOCS|nr:hypothetical protein [Rhodospirillum centenum]ACJ00099.1 hypothetical protein RC1_2724 [Rhodospirillum centenum SW]